MDHPSDYKVLGTNLFVYQPTHTSGNYPFTPAHADVCDVAKAHVGASASTPECRRIIFSSHHGLDFKVLSKEFWTNVPALKIAGQKTLHPPSLVTAMKWISNELPRSLVFAKRNFTDFLRYT